MIGPIKYKKWWTATKKLLVKDPRVGVPNKKTEPYILRDEPVKPEEEILEQFHGTKELRRKRSSLVKSSLLCLKIFPVIK